jgi:hypothetical protein
MEPSQIEILTQKARCITNPMMRISFWVSKRNTNEHVELLNPT